VQRTIFIGDVHGCIDELEALMAMLAPREGDRLAFVGDLVDRGPDSVAVVRRVQALMRSFPGSACVCGNHEEKMLRARELRRPPSGWAKHASEDDWTFLSSLPLVHAYADLGAVVVHGGFFPRYFEHYGEVGEIPPDWRTARSKRADRMRRFLRVRHVDAAGDMVALGKENAGTAQWSARYDGRAGFCFFGHDPQLSPPEPLRGPHALGLDTGCCFGGRLTAAIVTTDPRAPEVVSVPALARYAEPRRMHEE
jgi:bis(5'-nucleosyl)-tetraphosphatase (symmetrical)